MIPFAAGQVLAAFWSTWLEGTVDADDEIGRLPFSTFSHVPCPGYDETFQASTEVTAIATGSLPQNITAFSPANNPIAAVFFSPVDGLAASPEEAEAAAAAVACISCKYTFSSVVVHVVLTLTFTVIIATFGRVMLDRCGNKV